MKDGINSQAIKVIGSDTLYVSSGISVHPPQDGYNCNVFMNQLRTELKNKFK